MCAVDECGDACLAVFWWCGQSRKWDSCGGLDVAIPGGVWRVEKEVHQKRTCVGSSGANCVVVGLVVLVEKTKSGQTYEIRIRIAAKARLVSAEWVLHRGFELPPNTNNTASFGF